MENLESKPKELVEDNSEHFAAGIIDTAIEILDVWRPHRRGVSPSATAAAAVYGAARLRTEHEGPSQKMLSNIFGISELTIRNHYRDAIEAFAVEQS
jgi:transcription initiation factor TFIIIB Brf1 subunit/transcription initiation factor TFIIB